MAKNKNRNRAGKTTEPGTVEAPATVETSEAPATVVETETVNSAAAQGEVQMVTLKLLKVKKNGSASYGIAGLVGSVRVAKGLLGTAGAPAQLVIASDGFAQPDPVKAEKMAARAERKSKRTETREQRLSKAQERATKAQERAAKMAARAEKLAAKLTPKTDAPVEQTATA